MKFATDKVFFTKVLALEFPSKNARNVIRTMIHAPNYVIVLQKLKKNGVKHMNQQANLLRIAVEAKKKELISCLKDYGIHEMPNGQQLHELTLTELQEIARGVS